VSLDESKPHAFVFLVRALQLIETIGTVSSLTVHSALRRAINCPEIRSSLFHNMKGSLYKYTLFQKFPGNSRIFCIRVEIHACGVKENVRYIGTHYLFQVIESMML
jgi:hypothetical protein